MQRGHPQLIELIRDRVLAYGPVSFAWFMEQALYHPEHGYYSSGRAKLGRRGDYFTNVSVGRLLGCLLTIQLNEIWQQLGEPEQYIAVEQGAHEGRLANDVLSALAKISPACFAALQYRIIEPSSTVQQLQRQSLNRFSQQIEWFNALDALDPFVGVHLSNELLDAFPVHLVSAHQHAGAGDTCSVRWMEKLVSWRSDQFVFIHQPISDPRVQEYVRELPPLPPDSEVEINLAALDWIDCLSTKARTGYVFIIDYGLVQHDFSSPHRWSGTLQCRAGHHLIHSPLADVGNCDITAHVNWTSVARRAVAQHLDVVGFTDQHHFLTGIVSTHPELVEFTDPKMRRQLQTLLHPEMMGRSFQVLALSRAVDGSATLSGFKFLRPNWKETLIGE